MPINWARPNCPIIAWVIKQEREKAVNVMNPLRQTYRRLAAELLLAVLLGAAIPSLAVAEGYWACSEGSWVAAGHPGYPPPLKSCGSHLDIPHTEAECAQVKGVWGPAGLFPKPICRVPTQDGGRVCGDDDECEGMCLASLTPAERDLLMRKKTPLAKSGHCTAHTPIFGCLAIVKQGLVTGLMCRD
jgi:hypothetical protein